MAYSIEYIACSPRVDNPNNEFLLSISCLNKPFFPITWHWDENIGV